MNNNSTHVPEIAQKRALDAPLYAISSGRSMVEMLGVLAIIGVLSVGAIAGYSKAMMKHKLNKQTHQLTSIINGVLATFANDTLQMPHNTYFKDTLIKLDIIPAEMIKDNSDKVYDAMGNPIAVGWETVTYWPFKARGGFFKLHIGNNSTVINYDTCRNILELSRDMHASIWQTHFIYQAADEDRENYGVRRYGSQHCKKNTSECLHTLKASDIKDLCDTCVDQKNCQMRILW